MFIDCMFGFRNRQDVRLTLCNRFAFDIISVRRIIFKLDAENHV
jgi:hypothetical protein